MSDTTNCLACSACGGLGFAPSPEPVPGCVCAETSIRNCPVHGQDAPAPAPERDGELEGLLIDLINAVSGQYNLVGDDAMKAPYRERLRDKQAKAIAAIHALFARREAEAREAGRREMGEVAGYIALRSRPGGLVTESYSTSLLAHIEPGGCDRFLLVRAPEEIAKRDAARQAKWEAKRAKEQEPRTRRAVDLLQSLGYTVIPPSTLGAPDAADND